VPRIFIDYDDKARAATMVIPCRVGYFASHRRLPAPDSQNLSTNESGAVSLVEGTINTGGPPTGCSRK
jgi:hypothetical protein